MDCTKIGKLLLTLRKEKQLTQKQLADTLHVSDKAVSKWERGLGCPDITLLNNIAKVYQVNIEKILDGELEPNNEDGGNMKKIKFYTCSTCGNIMTSTGDPEISCCGRKIQPMQEKKCDDDHNLSAEDSEGDLYITFTHEMSKKHFINFIASVSYDRVLLVRLYPEQGGELRIPKLPCGKIYFGCTNHGLWIKD